MQIPYTATNFPATSQNNLISSHALTTTWKDIVWAAITVGKPGASHLLAHRWHSLADMVVRTYSIYANLRQRGILIDRSTLYDSLDPTEKGATSYFLGMAMAKLFAAERFQTPRLFHVSQARASGATISFKRGSKSQPDLVGQTATGDWIVVEAKGRTSGFDTAALVRAKDQTRMIRTINGTKPSLRVALQVYFCECMEVRIDDPSDEKAEALDVELDLDAALLHYYSLARAIMAKASAREVVHDQEFVMRIDEDSGVTIGLQASLLRHLQVGNLAQHLENANREGAIEIDADTAIYPDGILVRLDSRWSSQLMEMEPQARDSY